MHKQVDLAIHYWGTPVVLLSTINEDGSTNIAPMSSIWWLGWSCMLGLDASSQTVANLRRHQECVVNLCAADNSDAVNRLALLTGSKNIPIHKKALGYRHESQKFHTAELTEISSEMVKPSRVLECPVHLEAVVESIVPFAKSDPRMAIASCAVELRILRTWVKEDLLTGTKQDRINADIWRPLLMSFRNLFHLGDRVPESRLATGSENQYAPWKGGPAKAIAGKAVRFWSQMKHGNFD